MAQTDRLWSNTAIMKNLNLHLFDYPGVMPSAIQGVKDLFHIANLQAEDEIFTVSTVNTSNDLPDDVDGVMFIPPSLTDKLPGFDDPVIIALFRKWHQSGTILVSACSSVFWLANAGLLDGKYATTHWRLCERLANDYPAIEKVCVDEMVVDQGDIVTAAGLYAFQDLALHIIARFAGFELAKKVADYCLLDLKGRLQAYYKRFLPDYSHGDAQVVSAQKFCLKNFYGDLPVSTIAASCHLSERSLLRRFKSATGYTPKQYIIQLRIEKAKQLMELENMSVEAAGCKVGYLDVSNFTKIFKKNSGITPAEFKLRGGN